MAGGCPDAADGAAMAPATRARSCLRSMMNLVRCGLHHYSAIARTARKRGSMVRNNAGSLAVFDQHPLAGAAEALPILLQAAEHAHIVSGVGLALAVATDVGLAGRAIFRRAFRQRNRQWERKR